MNKLFFNGFKAIALSCLIVSMPLQTLSAAASKQQYIQENRQLAIRVMNMYGVPASICMAQAILESKYGNSALSTRANNHFGIKCKSEWTGGTYALKDDDYDANNNLVKSCFRAYSSTEESYMDYGNFLKNRSRYTFLFETIDTRDYRGWAYGLVQAGYATNPKYAELLIKIVEENNLTDLDVSAFPEEVVFGQSTPLPNQTTGSEAVLHQEVPEQTNSLTPEEIWERKYRNWEQQQIVKVAVSDAIVEDMESGTTQISKSVQGRTYRTVQQRGDKYSDKILKLSSDNLR